MNRFSERRNLVELWFSPSMRVFTDMLEDNKASIDVHIEASVHGHIGAEVFGH